MVPREVRFAHPRQAAPATPFTRSRAAMPPEEPPPPEPGTLALVRGKRFIAHERDVFQGVVRRKRFNAHERVIFQGDVRGKRFIAHGMRCSQERIDDRTGAKKL